MTRLRHWVRWVWPRPGAEDEVNPPSAYVRHYDALTAVQGMRDTVLAARILEFSKDLFERAEARREHIESRANTTLTIAGIVVALVGGFGAVLGPDCLKGSQQLPMPVVVLVGASLVYLVGALLDGIGLHGKLIRHTMGPEDLVPHGVSDEQGYALQLSTTLITHTIENYKTNNKAAALLFASQGKLRRGVILLVIASLYVLAMPVIPRLGMRPVPAGSPGPSAGSPGTADQIPKTDGPQSPR